MLFTIHFQFTPRAMAATRQGLEVEQLLADLPLVPVVGDLIELPGTQSPVWYEVVERRLRLQGDNVALEVVLDLLQRPLRSV